MTNKDCPRYKKCRQEWAEAKYRESVAFTCHNCIRGDLNISASCCNCQYRFMCNDYSEEGAEDMVCGYYKGAENE